MGRKRYMPAPEVPANQAERLRMMLEVLAGSRTVSEAARTLGMSRNHFQTLMHKGLAGMVESITPKPGGRPGKAPEVAQLETQLEQLKRENARLKDRVDTTDRLLQAASGLLQGRIRPARQPRTKKTPGAGDDDGEGARRRLEEIEALRRLGLTEAFAASVAGVHPSTVRRWRHRAGSPPSKSRGTGPAPQAIREASALVRSLRGQVGAEAIRHSVPGISRRQAARVKEATLTDMERCRKARLTRVRVTVPGVVRGMDGMWFDSDRGHAHALICADAAVCYRTSVKVATSYDAHSVWEALAADIEHNGAPLIYRLDRASCHDAPCVRELLEEHQVLVLHGPPRCPRFYGQLERQNREHRAWDYDVAQLPPEMLESCLEEMLEAVNRLWRRRTLAWHTASEVWTLRPRLVIDRTAFRMEVEETAARLRPQLQDRGKPADLAQRLAIERALETRGYLRQTPGGWC